MTTALHPLTAPEAAHICEQLHNRGIDVGAAEDTDHIVHVWPEGPITVLEEVTALAAFLARTPQVNWHPYGEGIR